MVPLCSGIDHCMADLVGNGSREGGRQVERVFSIIVLHRTVKTRPGRRSAEDPSKARGAARRQDCIGELDEVLKTSLPCAGGRYCGNCAALPYNVSELFLVLIELFLVLAASCVVLEQQEVLNQ